MVRRTYEAIFPEGTTRRNIIRAILAPIMKILSPIRRFLGAKKRDLSLTLSFLPDKHTADIKQAIAHAGNVSGVIVIDSIMWDAQLKQRPQHMALELAKLKKWLVVYLDTGAPAELKLRKVSKYLLVINNERYLWLLKKITHKFFVQYSTTTKNTLSDLRRIKRLGFGIIYSYIDEIDPRISGDSIEVQLNILKHLDTIRPVMLVASASGLYKELEERFGSEILLMVKNAADITSFDYNNHSAKDAHPPTDLKAALKTKKPIIGYYGAMAPWLDYSLLNNLAKTCPNLNFVYIGPDYGDALKKLDTRDNVYNLGKKPYEDLPKYSRHFDCAIIPFKHGGIAKSTSPLKLFEYMAMGLPTVCTRDLIECYGYDFVYVSKNDKDFKQHLESAIADKTRAAARKRLLDQAKENTWEKRAQVVDDFLDRLIKK